MTQRVHVIVSGRVQGVCFRMYTVEEAERLGLTGWVRNRPDGTVEIIAEGDKEAIHDFAVWCGRGPSHARVTEAKVNYSEPVGQFSGFKIRY